ncbi:MAG: VWA domain-containing protein [Deltaproteobacteria bacterium]|nr:MAG: VWA domain-containing protein [Deltaproteobacteria bacterium]
MVATATRIRTSFVLGAAAGTVIAALAMTPRGAAFRPSPEETSADGMVVSARFPTRRILPGVQDQNLAVTITAPPAADLSLGLAIVIDRSGSMHGPPIENAKAAALSMLRQLDGRDAFAVVTYSSGARTVVAMQRATEAGKAAARAAIETIDDDGGTCISCGLDTAGAELARSPIADGLRRILLISDGQANEGVYDRDELAQLASATAERGASISTVGVGLDFDEATMRRLAEVGRGNYYFVEDTVALSTMFGRELATLSQTVAQDVRLIVRPEQLGGQPVRIAEAYGYPMLRTADGVIVPVADLRAGETRKVVLRLQLAAPRGDELVVAHAEVSWRSVADGTRHRARAAATVDVVDDPAAVAASVDAAATQAVEKALSARALEDAAAAYEHEGLPAAQQVLDRRAQAVRAAASYLDHDTVEALDAASSRARDGFARAPEQAKKAASVDAHELAR